MLLPSAGIHSFANNCPLYFVKYSFGLLVYNDDSFVYAARLEDDIEDGISDTSASENLSSSDVGSDFGSELDVSSDSVDQAAADVDNVQKQQIEDGERHMEQLEEKMPKDAGTTDIEDAPPESTQENNEADGQDEDMEEVVADASL